MTLIWRVRVAAITVSFQRYLLAAILLVSFGAKANSGFDLQFERLRGVRVPNVGNLIGESDIDANSFQVAVTRSSSEGTRNFFLTLRDSEDVYLGPFSMEAGRSRLVLSLPIIGEFPAGSRFFELQLNLSHTEEGVVDTGRVVLWDNRAPATLDYSFFNERPARRAWSSPYSGLREFLAAAGLDASWEERLQPYTFWVLQADGTVAAWENLYADIYDRRIFRADGMPGIENPADANFPRSIRLHNGRRLELPFWAKRPNELVVLETNGVVTWSAAIHPPGGAAGNLLQWLVVKTNETLEVGLSLQHYQITQFPEINGERLHGTSARLLLNHPEVTTAVRQRRRHRVVRESEGKISVEVRKLGDYDKQVVIHYQTRAGTAKEGSDYARTAGTLFFRGGETTKWIEIPIMQDSIAEPVESFFLDFSPTNLSATPRHEITIQEEMKLEWLGDDIIRVWQPPYRTLLWTKGDLSSWKEFQTNGNRREFLTPCADYIDLSFPEIREEERSGTFFIVGEGNDDDLFNLWLP